MVKKTETDLPHFSKIVNRVPTTMANTRDVLMYMLVPYRRAYTQNAPKVRVVALKARIFRKGESHREWRTT